MTHIIQIFYCCHFRKINGYIVKGAEDVFVSKWDNNLSRKTNKVNDWSSETVTP